MNVPVFDQDKVIIIAGVGNKKSPYDDSDVRQLILLMEGMWHIFRRKQIDEDLDKMKSYRSELNKSDGQVQ